MCGIDVFSFWDYTLSELVIIVTAHNERIMNETRSSAANTYILADLIGASVARLMDNKAKYPPIHEVFPKLFDAPVLDAETERVKAQWLAFADAHNNRRQEK